MKDCAKGAAMTKENKRAPIIVVGAEPLVEPEHDWHNLLDSVDSETVAKEARAKAKKEAARRSGDLEIAWGLEDLADEHRRLPPAASWLEQESRGLQEASLAKELADVHARIEGRAPAALGAPVAVDHAHSEKPAATPETEGGPTRGVLAPAEAGIPSGKVNGITGNTDRARPAQAGAELPQPLNTKTVALLFADIKWSEDRWSRNLADCPEWLLDARTQAGQRGKSPALWNPVEVAIALMGREGLDVECLRHAFRSGAKLSAAIAAWVPEWQRYETDRAWGTEADT